MESVAVLSQNHTDYSSMEKSDVSKSLYGLIQWEEILRSGVFLAHRDVRFASWYHFLIRNLLSWEAFQNDSIMLQRFSFITGRSYGRLCFDNQIMAVGDLSYSFNSFHQSLVLSSIKAHRLRQTFQFTSELTFLLHPASTLRKSAGKSWSRTGQSPRL